MTTDIFCFYFQNRQIQTSQTRGQRYSDTSPFIIPWLIPKKLSGDINFFLSAQVPGWTRVDRRDLATRASRDFLTTGD
jgi:hypothetical protein